MSRVRLATRGSPLARWQAETVAALIRGLDPAVVVEIGIVRTSGDGSQASFTAMSAVGVFVKEIEDALLRGDADLAVHSLKDLPTVQPRGLTVAAVLAREDPSDALVTRDGGGLDSLPAGARVATASPRRQALLRHLTPNLVFVAARGNVDTRLGKLAKGEFEALVLALAGLKRLGLDQQVGEVFTPERMLPAPGQGAIAIEACSGSSAAALASRLDHRPTRIAVDAERSFLFALGGGCAVPVGALAEVTGESLRLRGVIADPEDGGAEETEITGPAAEPKALGVALAVRMREVGGRILASVLARLPLAGRRVLVTRAAGTAGETDFHLRALGAEVIEVPAIVIVPPADPALLAATVAGIARFDWVALTSANAVAALGRALAEAGIAASAVPTRFAVVGNVTAAALRGLGVEPALVAAEMSGAGLAGALKERLARGERVLFPCAREASPALGEGLAAAGFEVVAVEAYRTVSPEGLAADLAAAATTPIDVIYFASPSAVRHLIAAAADSDVGQRIFAIAAIACIGDRTAQTAEALGLTVRVRPATPAPADLAAALVEYFQER